MPLSAVGFGSRHLSDAGTRRAAEQIALKISLLTYARAFAYS